MNISIINFINSLTGSEKRYVHLMLKTFNSEKEDNKILNDFLLIEGGLLNKKSSGFKISSNPTRFYYKILEILHAYHNQSLSNGNSDRNFMDYANLLLLKGNYDEATKFLNKVISNPLNSNYLIKIEAIELKIKTAIESANVDYLNNDLFADKQLLDKLTEDYFNLLEYERLWAMVKLESAKNYFYGNKIDFYNADPNLLVDEKYATTPLAKIYFNKIKGFLSIKNNELNEVFKYAYRTIEIFETNQNIKKSMPQEYLRSIRNLCICYTQVKNYDKAEDLLNNIDLSFINQKKINQHELILELFTLFILLRMDIIISNDNIDNNIHKIAFFENELKKNELILRNEEKASSYYYLSVFYIHIGDYKKALKCVNRAKVFSGSGRKDIGQLATIAELVIHYFLGNTDLLTSKLLSYKRIISKEEHIFAFEKECIKLLTQVFADQSNKSLFLQLHREIEASLEAEKKSVYRAFVTFLYLKPIQ